jgi:hypothetical protein
MATRATLPPDTIVRDGRVEDAEQLAGFFRLSYGDSSHPCQDPGRVRDTIVQGSTSWFVAVRKEQVLACGAVIPHPWNGTCETCRIFVRPDCRYLDLGRRILQMVMGAAYRQSHSDLVFAAPRSHGIYLMIRHVLETPAVLLGHDGGMQVAHGIREYHLFCVTRDPNRMFSRVIPPGCSIAKAPFIIDQIVSPLALTTEVGEYPSRAIVGPPSAQRAEVDGCILRYDHDAASPSQSLQVTSVSARAADADRVVAALAAFLASRPSVQHVSAYVLIHEVELIRRMRWMGFAITAYFPAWYADGGRRYDCVMLVQRRFAGEPIAHGTEETIALFDAHLNGLP